MLVLVEDNREKSKAQKAMEASITGHLQRVGKRNIGFPSGNVDEIMYANGDGSLWAAFSNASDAKVPRRWNAFGVFDSKRYAQMISVEINIPTTSNSASVAGFFARDPSTGATYLMHDGSVGGGKKGVGRGAFISWSDRELVDVERSEGGPRPGIVIGRVDDSDLAGRIWNFVRNVRDFKDAVKRGDLDSEAARRKIAAWNEFREEASGRRKGRRRAEIDYVSYHGDVVKALRDEREAKVCKGERVVNSLLVDLMVKTDAKMTEIYEVKTDCGRQSLYTAIGQLMTHSVGTGTGIVRTLVVPEGDLPDGLALCFAELGITLRRFRLTAAPNRKVVLL
ncbi:hypothetical protein [Sphingopyxis sp. GC21]|uniref:hypothetical protein n=1 Tax=Sphingopyxis sp. GC21 TaxID=2933562 RepID=UPI0021E4D6B1|nr:hypothetical protein [Sphingopyxis sp. GC21]